MIPDLEYDIEELVKSGRVEAVRVEDLGIPREVGCVERQGLLYERACPWKALEKDKDLKYWGEMELRDDGNVVCVDALAEGVVSVAGVAGVVGVVGVGEIAGQRGIFTRH